jgi:signal recognition particle receptor subunit beta
LPVTVVTGFLGSGKTTLIRALLDKPEGAGTPVALEMDFLRAAPRRSWAAKTHRFSGGVRSARGGARLPVVVVTGFLGSGKTTLIRASSTAGFIAVSLAATASGGAPASPLLNCTLSLLR